eukprot:362807-Chlamydomonas_euryale.AAC.3
MHAGVHWLARMHEAAERSESDPRLSNYHPETTFDCSETAVLASDRSCHGLRAHQTALRPLLPGSKRASDRSQAAVARV